MIRQLRLSNLKAFEGRHEVNLAPLTLIYGSNSAGKSTLIQSLLLLKQTIESSDPEQPALVARGTLADLGSVPGIIHGHELDRTLELGLSIDPTERVLSRSLGDSPRRYGFSFVWDPEVRAVRQTGARFGLGDDDLVVYTRRRGPATVKTAAEAGRRDFPFRIGQKPARETFVRWLLDPAVARRGPGFALRELSRLADEDAEAVLSALIDRVSYAGAPWSIVPGYPAFAVRDPTDVDRALGEIVESMEMLWRRMNTAFRLELTDALDSLVYLGPLRRAPARFHVSSGARRRSVGREGEYAAEILSRDKALEGRVNEWLRRLGIDYTVEAGALVEEELGTTLGDVVVLVLTDTRSQLKVSPGDVGFGISQLLPIIVQTLVGKGNVVCVEQPEIHVHPRLQAQLADLFKEVARDGRGNQLIIETHSEHLMLRLQRHVHDGELSPDDVAVLYVDTDERGNASVFQLRLDDDGSFLDEWPQGFFEERFAEVFPDHGS